MSSYPGMAAQAQPATSNPYDELLQACAGDAASIQARYEHHRQNRNELQRAKLLSRDFQGVQIDQTLFKLVNSSEYPDYVDPRHCLVFWARPTEAIKYLVSQVHMRLKEAVPNMWFMPPDNLHMTALEITHSLTEPEISTRLEQLESELKRITDYTFYHRAKLIRPMLSFDAAAMALSFVPAGRESDSEASNYTYHHLRRDLYELCSNAGVKVDSRYVLPSAHLTVARFVNEEDTASRSGDTMVVDASKMDKLISCIDEINTWLCETYWNNESNTSMDGQWNVGQEKGLDCQRGTLWYGNGTRVLLGKGF